MSLTLNQRVRIKPGHYQQPSQRNLTFSIIELVRAGHTEMASLMDDAGKRHRYFAADQLELVPAERPTEATNKELANMSIKKASEQLLDLTNQYKRENDCDDRTALLAVSRLRRDLAAGHREVIFGDGNAADVTGPPGQTLLSSPHSDDSFVSLVARVKADQNVDDRQAMHLASRLNPDLAKAYENGR